MGENALTLEEEIVKCLFQSRPIGNLIENIAEVAIFSDITKPYLKNSLPLSYICACTCEGLLAKSHFFSSTILHALVCLGELEPFRLAYGHSIPKFEELFRNSDLANEPLYRVKHESNDSLDVINSEVNALQATEEILNIYSDKPDKYYLHPYKVYWFLVSKLNIDTMVASRYHSTQGLLRLIIQFIHYYNGYRNGEYLEVNKIVSLYEKLEPEIKKDNPEVLPIGVDFEFTQVSNILEIFFDRFIEFSMKKDSNARLACLSRLTNMAIQTIRLLNEYQSSDVTNKMDSLLSILDSKLRTLYDDLRESRLANYYFHERWREKCKITTRYRPLPFLNRVDEESDIFRQTIQELQSHF
jgi:hypothetical protein